MNKAQRKPNLFIIGAMKSGTSSLHQWLATHPQILMCEPKEPCYFVDRAELDWPYIEQLGLWRDERLYLNLFRNAGSAAIIGESSTLYTKAPRITGVPHRIAEFNPAARFIYLMRDPVERTVSHYWHMVRHHGEHRPMERAIRDDPEYCSVSNYAMQLRHYFEIFDTSRVLILTLEELVQDTVQIVQRIFKWLGVEATFVPPNLSVWENVTPPVVTQVKGRGILDRFRYSSLWCAVGSHVPAVIRRFGRTLSERTVERDSRMPISMLNWLRPIQREQTETLKQLLNRDFPEWTTLYSEPDYRPTEIAFTADRNATLFSPK